jgi:hypothetical protein
MKKHLAVSLQKDAQFENCTDAAAWSNEKGRHPPGSAPTNRILSKTSYFPFFGPLASSFFPFFFIVKLLSRAVPMGHGVLQF